MTDTFDTELEEKFGWFDRKYSEKNSSVTLEDSILALREFPLECTPRQKRQMEDYLKKILFRLEKDYKPSLDFLAYNALRTFAPLCGESTENLKGYIRTYEKTIEKYKDQRVFSSNFKSSREN